MEKEAKLKNTYTISEKLAQTKLYYDFFQDIQVSIILIEIVSSVLS